jgi:hypothetical protein
VPYFPEEVALVDAEELLVDSSVEALVDAEAVLVDSSVEPLAFVDSAFLEAPEVEVHHEKVRLCRVQVAYLVLAIRQS